MLLMEEIWLTTWNGSNLVKNGTYIRHINWLARFRPLCKQQVTNSKDATDCRLSPLAGLLNCQLQLVTRHFILEYKPIPWFNLSEQLSITPTKEDIWYLLTRSYNARFIYSQGVRINMGTSHPDHRNKESAKNAEGGGGFNEFEHLRNMGVLVLPGCWKHTPKSPRWGWVLVWIPGVSTFNLGFFWG